VLAPIDESGRFLPGYGEFEGRAADAVAEPVTEFLREHELLVGAETIVHRYPVCWRCRTPLVFRVVDDWFISCEEIRQPMLDANATVAWTPPQYKKRMDDWLRNMGDWNISRRRYFGLPLPFYPCECGHLNVIGSRAELDERATSGLDLLEELHRPWIDAVRIRCEQCGRDVERIQEVGDAWLDAGIVHFSTLGWQNPEWIPEGNATGSARGLTHADLPDHAYWEQWFPADWVSENRTQIRLWFYSQCFMAVTLDGRQPYRSVLTYENLLDEQGREMHKSRGNSIELNEALDRMGADVMRWLYCEQNPAQELRFGYALADDVKRRLLTFWNSVSFFITYANVEGFDPSAPAGELRPLDRWLISRTSAFVLEATANYERYWTPGVVDSFERFIDDLSNWYIRRSRPRFWNGDATALRVLWDALATSLRVIAPVMPFLAESLWHNLVSKDESVFLAGWPEVGEYDEQLVEEIAEVRRIVELGRQARGDANLKLRQPLRRMSVVGAKYAKAHEHEILSELRVKELTTSGPITAARRLKPNLPLLGPKLGSDLTRVRAALENGDAESLPNGGWRVDGHELSAEEVLVERRTVGDGWVLAEDPPITVLLETSLDDELLREGRVLELVHAVNTTRRLAGLDLTDRIRLLIPFEDEDLLVYADRIKEETLALSVELGPELKLERA
jgi:isoleucyl-tRNA synthetase